MNNLDWKQSSCSVIENILLKWSFINLHRGYNKFIRASRSFWASNPTRTWNLLSIFRISYLKFSTAPACCGGAAIYNLKIFFLFNNFVIFWANISGLSIPSLNIWQERHSPLPPQCFPQSLKLRV